MIKFLYPPIFSFSFAAPLPFFLTHWKFTIGIIMNCIFHVIMGYDIRKMFRELYILNDSLSETKQKTDEHLKVVIPPAIATLMRGGQYLFLT